jgi:hypothetical protein
VLAVLGSVLMGITLLSKFDIEIRDVPVYVAPRAASPALPDLPNPSSLLLPLPMLPKESGVPKPSGSADAEPAGGGKR